MRLPSPDAQHWDPSSSRRATASPEPRDHRHERSAADGRGSVPGVSPGSSVPPAAAHASSGKKRKCEHCNRLLCPIHWSRHVPQQRTCDLVYFNAVHGQDQRLVTGEIGVGVGLPARIGCKNCDSHLGSSRVLARIASRMDGARLQARAAVSASQLSRRYKRGAGWRGRRCRAMRPWRRRRPACSPCPSSSASSRCTMTSDTHHPACHRSTGLSSQLSADA